jgi:hypothetical protein
MERRNDAGQAAVLLLVIVATVGIALMSALVEVGAITQ